MSTIGQTIRRAREAKGLTQEALAELSQTSQTTIDKIERNITKRSRVLYRIAKHLELSLSELDPEIYGEAQLPAEIKTPAALHSVYIAENSPAIPVFALNYAGSQDPENEVDDPVAGIMSEKPFEYIDRPKVSPDGSEIYGIYISTDIMEPELLPGDTIFMDPRLPVIKNATTLFILKEDRPARILARLTNFDLEYWYVKQWKYGFDLRIPRTMYDRAHRVVAKYYRR